MFGLVPATRLSALRCRPKAWPLHSTLPQVTGAEVCDSSPPRPPPLIRIVYNLVVAKILPFTEARTHLTELLDEIERVHEHVVITRNGRPSAVVRAQAEDESLFETLEILGAAQLLAELAAMGEETGRGGVVPRGDGESHAGVFRSSV